MQTALKPSGNRLLAGNTNQQILKSTVQSNKSRWKDPSQVAYSSAEELTLIHNVLDEITIELKSTVKNGNFKTENGKIVKSLLDEFSKGMLDRLVKIVDEKIKAGSGTQGFQSGPVPGTFTRLRSCIVPAEITEPPPLK